MGDIATTITAALLLGGLLCGAVSAWTPAEQETLTGDWNGARTAWQERGISTEMVYIGEVFNNSRGGVSRGTEYLGNLDLTLALDGEPLWGWPGATLFFYLLGNHGGSPSERAGDVQTVSNIDAPDTLKLYEAWYEQRVMEDRLSFKFGLYDLNSEFDVIETAGLFINSSFGIGPDYAQSGLNGPSIFPTTAVALRLAFHLMDDLYLQAAVLDGVPGDPDDPYGTHIRFGSDDGLLLAAEIGYQAGLEDERSYRKLALGYWHYSERFDDLLQTDINGDPVRRRGNAGLYVIGESQLYTESSDREQGLTLFARYGVADDHINPFQRYWGAGMVYTGLVPGRDTDQLGVAVATVYHGKVYRQAQALAGTPISGREQTIEFSYRMQLLPWLALQPDMQWILGPGMDPGLRDVLMAGIRFEITL